MLKTLRNINGIFVLLIVLTVAFITVHMVRMNDCESQGGTYGRVPFTKTTYVCTK